MFKTLVYATLIFCCISNYAMGAEKQPDQPAPEAELKLSEEEANYTIGDWMTIIDKAFFAIEKGLKSESFPADTAPLMLQAERAARAARTLTPFPITLADGDEKKCSSNNIRDS